MHRFSTHASAADAKRYFSTFTLVILALAAVGGLGSVGFGLVNSNFLSKVGLAGPPNTIQSGPANALLQPVQTNTPLVTLTPTVTATRPTSTATQTAGSPTATETGTPPAGTTGTATQTRTRTATATTTGTAQATGTATGTVVATTTQTPIPTTTATAGKVTICHRTGSSSNPYRRITVSVNALPAHRQHGDIVPAPPAGCPAAQAPGAKSKTNNANGNQGINKSNNGNNQNNNGKANGGDQGKDKGKDKPGKRP